MLAVLFQGLWRGLIGIALAGLAGAIFVSFHAQGPSRRGFYGGNGAHTIFIAYFLTRRLQLFVPRAPILTVSLHFLFVQGMAPGIAHSSYSCYPGAFESGRAFISYLCDLDIS